MPIIYTKLFELMKEKNIHPSDFRYRKVLSSATITKLGKNQRVSLSVMETLCEELQCGLGDIAEFVPSKHGDENGYNETIDADIQASDEDNLTPLIENSTIEPDAVVANPKAPDNDAFILGASGFYYQKSTLERDKINLPHKFETNDKYPYKCPETGYAYRITDFGAFERLDDPEK